MTVSHLEATRNGIADYVVDQLNSGSLIFYAADGITEVATLTFAATAFGAATAGVAIAGTITSDIDATGGTTTIAKLATSGGSKIVECSVGVSGEDINLSNNIITTGDTLSISSLTYTAPV